jgi:UDP-glucose 4-epimerase
MMPKIAVLGASGFLGSPIADLFEEKGWEVIAFSRTVRASSSKQRIYADLFEEESLRRALLISRPNVVLSAAWDTEHGKFWTNESNVNYKVSTLKFAELSFQAGAETFIGLGSRCEYGTSPGYCNASVSPLIPNDLYSMSKIETGIALKEIGERFGGQTYWARVFQAFGPNEKEERLVPWLIAKLQNNEKFSIRTPNYKMDWIHTEDIASAIVYAIENKLDHFVDIGTGVATSVKEFSELICEEFDLDESLLDFTGQIPDHEMTAVVDSASQLLSRGWQPAKSLRKRVRSLG